MLTRLIDKVDLRRFPSHLCAVLFCPPKFLYLSLRIRNGSKSNRNMAQNIHLRHLFVYQNAAMYFF